MERDALGRFVLDTNSIVSAFLFPNSLPGCALEFVLVRGRLLLSLETAAELANVMRREKFSHYLSLSRREELVAGLIRDSDFVETSTTVTACRDLQDNRFLELAVDGHASAVVTGDTDLLDLHAFNGIPICTPRDFVSRFVTS